MSKTSTATAPPNARHAPWLVALGLMGLALLLHAPAFQGGFIWDDFEWIVDNANHRDVNGLWRAWVDTNGVGRLPYFPLTFTTFWAEYQLVGAQPWLYRVDNAVLHGLAGVLIAAVARRWGVAGGGWAAALFVVHPVHVESVAWIVERKNTLSAVFTLAALWCWVEPGGFPRAQLGSRAALRTAALFTAALLAKSAVVMFPVVLLLWVVMFEPRARWRGALLSIAPLFMLSLVSGVVTLWTEASRVGTQGPEWARPMGERLAVAGINAWFYLGKLVWPSPVMFVYPRWQVSPLQVQHLFPAVAAALVLAAGWWLRNHRLAAVWAAVVSHWLLIAPLLAFLNGYFFRYSFVSDHFQYVPSIPVMLLAGAGMAALVRWRPVMRWAGVAATTGLFTMALVDVLDYRSEEVLWRASIEKNPDAWLAQGNLGDILLTRGELPAAEHHLRRALAANPLAIEPRNNLAIVLGRTARLPEALVEVDQVLSLAPGNANAHNTRGAILLAMSRAEEASAEFEHALALAPGHPEATDNLMRLRGARPPGTP